MNGCPYMDQSKTSLTYRSAGVDIDAGDSLVERIKPYAARTRRPEILGGLGGFGALAAIPSRYKNPILVSGTDGVGTKLKLAIDTKVYDTIGIDLVAMCVNDIIVSGAEPLFFLDYYATGKLDVDAAEQVIKGIAEGCAQAGAALVGGETAEMPGMYHGNDFDLAGFCVGVVELDDIIHPIRVKAGDLLIGLPSSGPHSNGYSLIRKVLEVSGASLDSEFEGTTLGQALLEPTRIYAEAVLTLIRRHPSAIHGLAHITGGGLTENLPRALPVGTQANIQLGSWQMPAIFEWLRTTGNIDGDEMLRTFNCGIGMVLVVDVNSAHAIFETCHEKNIDYWQIGEIAASTAVEPFVNYVL